jgi:hypothetical protein
MYDINQLQNIQQSQELQDAEYFLCREDPYHWLTHWAFTIDEHTPEAPFKLFPDKEYIKIIVKIWLKCKKLIIPKSRQMMISWIMTGLYMHDTQFNRARKNFFQSKKADDADALVARAKIIWDHEPKFLKRFYDEERRKWIDIICNPQVNGAHVYNKLELTSIDSIIRGIPEGDEVVRSYVLSGLLADEMAFQPEARGAYAAALPALSNRGRFTGVSTALDGTFFQQLVFDRSE